MQQEAPPAPPPAPTGNGQANYDFIFNDNKPGKKSLIPMGGGKKGRIIVVAAGAMIVLILIFVIIGLISNAGKADTTSLISAAKQQQELIRVSKIGVDKAKTQAAKNIAVTTLLALESEQDDMQAAVTAAGLNAKKVLVSAPNVKTDQALNTAEQNNRFDEEFLSIMTSSLITYQKSVKTAYDGATSAKLKAALTTQFNSANTLAGVAAATE